MENMISEITGFQFIGQYKKGKLSLENTAKELHLPLTDLLDLFAEL